MLLKITSSVAGIFALSAFLGLFLPIVHTSCMVFQTNRTSIFMVAFFTVINCAFMAMFFVTWKICDSSSFVAAEIALKSDTLMGGLCVYCQVVLQFCFVFTIFTFISHTIFHCSLSFCIICQIQLPPSSDILSERKKHLRAPTSGSLLGLSACLTSSFVPCLYILYTLTFNVFGTYTDVTQMPCIMIKMACVILVECSMHWGVFNTCWTRHMVVYTINVYKRTFYVWLILWYYKCMQYVLDTPHWWYIL